MATIPHPKWLYHADLGPRLFAPGDEHPGEGWSDAPHDRMPEADPVHSENAALRMQNAELKAENERLEALVAEKRRSRSE